MVNNWISWQKCLKIQMGLAGSIFELHPLDLLRNHILYNIGDFFITLTFYVFYVSWLNLGCNQHPHTLYPLFWIDFQGFDDLYRLLFDLFVVAPNPNYSCHLYFHRLLQLQRYFLLLGYRSQHLQILIENGVGRTSDYHYC